MVGPSDSVSRSSTGCYCGYPERILERPIGNCSERALNISEKYNNIIRDERKDLASKIGTWLWIFTLFIVPIVPISVLVSIPIVAVYIFSHPGQYSRDLSTFLADEHLTRDPTATDINVIVYIKNESIKFTSDTCGNCRMSDIDSY